MSTETEKLPQFTEFETKYRIELSVLSVFKKLVGTIPDLRRFFYTEGPDTYYTNPKNKFLRYRRTEDKANPFAQLTIKTKPDGAKNNIKRSEPNVQLTNTEPEEVEKFILDLNYEFNFKIWKMCHIYDYDDATIVFYSVREDGKDAWDHFIEIEVNEKTIQNYTEDEAWAVIEKYEKLLAETGINPQKRLRKSLFEMYVKENK